MSVHVPQQEHASHQSAPPPIALCSLPVTRPYTLHSKNGIVAFTEGMSIHLYE